jgi:hypothetical protein
MNESRMPALLVAHRRPGFYFRVIEGGIIEAGDLIEKVLDGPERMTVAEIDSLLYTADHPAASLAKALSIPSLSQGWQNSFKDLLNAAASGETSGNAGLVSQPLAPPAWTGFRKLRVQAVKQESEDVRSFELAMDGRRRPPSRFLSRATHRSEVADHCVVLTYHPYVLLKRNGGRSNLSNRSKARRKWTGERVFAPEREKWRSDRSKCTKGNICPPRRIQSTRPLKRGRWDYANAGDAAFGSLEPLSNVAGDLVDSFGTEFQSLSLREGGLRSHRRHHARAFCPDL